MVVPNSSKKEEVLKLIAEKEKLENKLKELGQILSVNNVSMSESLVDESGYPRNDIDVYQVRHARHQIICTQNDLKSLMKQIDQGLEGYFAECNLVDGGNLTKLTNYESIAISQEEYFETQTQTIAIAKVNLVSPKSPAEEAGIFVGDEVIEFGSLNVTNFKELTQIAEIVKHRENQRVIVKVKRENKYHFLNLTPKNWSGRGLLGCSIILLDAIER